jgi:hypothetical protein
LWEKFDVKRYLRIELKCIGRAYFWTASETDEQNTLEPPDKYAIIRSLKYSNDIFGILPWEKQDGLSVRCLKNL